MKYTIIKLLLWIGLVARKADNTIAWPFHVPPRWMFRNRPGVIKWMPGRLLPRRWGIGWAGFEIGDRGH